MEEHSEKTPQSRKGWRLLGACAVVNGTVTVVGRSAPTFQTGWPNDGFAVGSRRNPACEAQLALAPLSGPWEE